MGWRSAVIFSTIVSLDCILLYTYITIHPFWGFALHVLRPVLAKDFSYKLFVDLVVAFAKRTEHHSLQLLSLVLSLQVISHCP